jgi:hypothetical protein
MLTIRTEIIEDGTKVRAYGHDRSATIRFAHTQSDERNHGKALGTLLNKMLNSEQQAKLRHPSGARRVHESVPDMEHNANLFRDFYVDV